MNNKKICVIGAGYVGIPLAFAFSKHFDTTVYTHSKEHAEELQNGYDRTQNFTAEELKSSQLKVISDIQTVNSANIYIITVPTPVDDTLKPDLTPIISATSTVASVLKKGDIVVYESTVFIGCTEELCVPILEKESHLIYNEEFFCGYSPERINPTDKKNTLENVVKIVSGSTEQTKQTLVSLYGTIIKAGIYQAPSMKVAEASKLMENIQRDVNIALMNELSALYAKLGIATHDVIEAASTKWNFHKYFPGLVGGHCIGVDPYYILLNAENEHISMPIVEQARDTNEKVPLRIINEIKAVLTKRQQSLAGKMVLLLGIAYKENTNDIRNSKSAVVYKLLKENNAIVDVVDPYADKQLTKKSYNVDLLDDIPDEKQYDIIIVTLAHDSFKKINWKKLKKEETLLYDIKKLVPKEEQDFYF
ncbi:nucleotide sugar dehydrogenase [Sulfurimonas sp. C5]|uniref:nucleotide sugar dehydrogenase n=1 Tax=Sulfurimonas sp. C5 TaxID=3036947 RepID=UPI0024548C0C|nr:nucleotide sugar dehydrogenase [Sulfurimonas sp. C5]MDH4944788.1 nucleotide sugar dehydrogenase [Sulfurimonas sp. C5]